MLPTFGLRLINKLNDFRQHHGLSSHNHNIITKMRDVKVQFEMGRIFCTKLIALINIIDI